ncbi:hypothetical protein BLOT_006351 [Blomia tropicalis]|nr:hypothetical protein BLOT_006351 [Blomia tropicalis]
MGGNDQTFLKQAFQHDSSGTSTTTTTGYKQLKPSDETAIVNDVEEDGFSPSRNISSPSLATISATVGNSPVGTNPFKGANHSYRSQHHQYFPSGTNIHHGGPVTAQWIDDHHGSPGSITTITESNHSRTHIPKASSLTTPFNQRLVTNVREYQRVFQISVCLSTLTIALDLCCLFVCCIQFLSIVKLIKTPFGKRRSFEFIKKTSHIRILAIGAYLVSIPIFFTGVILYTFVNFDEIPALITSVIIGIGIIFCGVASVQNVYLWQWEKTKASQDMRQSQQAAMSTITNGQHHMTTGSIIHNGSHYPLELSTLV